MSRLDRIARQLDELHADATAALAAVAPAPGAAEFVGPQLPERLRPRPAPDPEPGPVLLSNGWWAHRTGLHWWTVTSTADDPREPMPPFCGAKLAHCHRWAAQHPRRPRARTDHPASGGKA
ncbi:hypothetical protein ACFYTF_04570 [Nocardia thailandica]|uniref:Uncharacterized protein n=1 Tax=Nocardia thailandica TaxID=257275 RepID=A0ABW6PIB7_9NOCA